MGSSDPFPSGFEIRFGSLNFQTTRNGYLMRITNRDELHPWRSTGPGPIPATPAADAPAPAQADATGPSAPRHRRHSDQRSRQARMERRRVARAAAQHDAPASGTTVTPAGEGEASGTRFHHGMRNAAAACASCASTDVAAYEDLPGERRQRGTHQRLERPTTMSLLPLRISKSFFVIYIPNTQVGCTNVNLIN
jgi:hypothetical protein